MPVWSEEELSHLVGREESQTLEFKSGRLLEGDPGQIALALSKAVSGLANARGGRLIIGMQETKQGKVRVGGGLDGVDGTIWPTDRLQQLVESNVEPPIRLRFSRVPISKGAQQVAFVIEVPEGVTAYQAKDGCYYARSEFETRRLRDYEIRLRMQRSSGLSGQLDVHLAARRLATAVLDEQHKDYQQSLEGLASTIAEAEQKGRLTPLHSDPSDSLPVRRLQAELRHQGQSLSPRLRFDEWLMTIVLKNTSERTIRDYDVHLEFGIPEGWLVTTRDDIQPRGGFHSEDDVKNAQGLRETRLNALALHPAFGGRLMPGMSADLARYLLLVPEGASLASTTAGISWQVYLDDSAPSRGEIDLIETLRRMRSA